MSTTFQLPTLACGAPARVIRFGNFSCDFGVIINPSGCETGHRARYTVRDHTGRVRVYVRGASTEEAELLFTTDVDEAAKPLLGLVTVLLNQGVALFTEIKRAATDAEPDTTVKITITADNDVDISGVDWNELSTGANGNKALAGQRSDIPIAVGGPQLVACAQAHTAMSGPTY